MGHKETTYGLKFKKRHGKWPADLRCKMRKELIVSLLGGQCQICQYKRCIRNLAFHHYEDKRHSLTMREMAHTLHKLLPEFKKCILVCHNCHGEIHEGLIDDHIVKKKNNKIRKLLKAFEGKRWSDFICTRLRNPVVKTCPYCKKTFQKRARQKYCSVQCGNMDNRKTKRPGLSELGALLQEKTLTSIGKMYNVSDNAVRKWAKKYRLI